VDVKRIVGRVLEIYVREDLMRLSVGCKLYPCPPESSKKRIQMLDSMDSACIASTVQVEVLVVEVTPLLLIHSYGEFASLLQELRVVPSIGEQHW
jgi:hypothetical protein